MTNGIFEAMGIDPGIVIAVMLVLTIIMFILILHINMKYDRLRQSYNAFMRGKDGKSLEDGIIGGFEEMDKMADEIARNKEAVRKLNEEMKLNFQKAGILKYDAFNEMGGKLSFALTLLDGNNNGYIINSMHSREGCYNYIKEIVNGESYIELSEEEAESLERALDRENYGANAEGRKRK